MSTTTNELEKTIEQTLLDVPKDEQLSSMFPNLIAYASNKAFLQQMVEKIKNMLLAQEVNTIYEAMGQLENTMFVEND